MKERKTKKANRILLCLLSACLLWLGPIPAKVCADVLIEVDDSFWRAHQEDCDYFYRSYMVNAPEGYAAIWESPTSARQREILSNGVSVYSNWHYTDDKGETWFAVMTGEMNYRGYDTIRGWMKTSDCLVKADYIRFREVYGQEFVEYDQAYGKALAEAETVVLWEYPCSGKVKADEIDAEWFDNWNFEACWKDPQGRMWAFVNYCYGIRNTWLCLDDPANAELEADESILPQTEVIYPAAEHLPGAKSGVTGLTVGAVLGVTAVTGVLLWVFFVRKRRAGKENIK